AGPTGNGELALAGFVLGGDAALSLADVLAVRSETASGIDLHFAAHVQGTGTGAGFQTIGVPAPEPDTALLLLLGLSGLAWSGRRRAPRSRALSIPPDGEAVAAPRRRHER